MWYKKQIEEIYQELNTNINGLKETEAKKRLEVNGLNIISDKSSKPLITVFFKQFQNPIIYILAFAAIFSLIIGEYIDALFVIIVVLMDAILGTIQEWRAEKSAESLKKIIQNKSKVIRNDEEYEINSEELVIGDIIALEPGDIIPADIRIITCYNFTVDESFLTGESLAEEKSIDVIEVDEPIQDRKNMCYAGSKVMTGRAKGVVVLVSKDTEIGKIAESVIFTDDAKTPLVIRMEKFTKQLSIITTIFSIILIYILYIKGYVLSDSIFLVIALAISAIPEGLPVVLTVALSIASSRMAKKNVIVKKLNSVEGLGSCTVIASDKTGTLTINEQTAQIIVLSDLSVYEINKDKITPVNAKENYKDSLDLLNDVIKMCQINNDAYLEDDLYKGDAIDVAFKNLAKIVYPKDDEEPLQKIPYESENKYSAAFYKKGKTYVTVKGSLEKISTFCKEKNEELFKQNEELSQKGYRVIAVAKGNIIPKKEYKEEDIENLEIIGLVGFIDPIREEAKEAIKKCHEAGIKVVMITGDHPLTATKIAKDLELIDRDDEVCIGSDIDKYLKDGLKQLDEFIKDKKVFSRVNPSQKLEIINSYKRQKEFIAVTGDGVNDAPALKGANIGIAMGSGTDVAKDTGSIIITDDNFMSITSGIEEGRFAYNNIRKVTYLLISCSLAEVLFFMLSIIFNYQIPLLAVQILWLNLVTEGIQDIALAFEKGENDVMKQKPRKTNESLFDKLLVTETLISGITMGLILFLTYIFLLDVCNFDIVIVRSYIILLMVILQNIQVLNSRSESKSVFKIPFKNNKFIALAILGTLALQIFASETTILDKVLHTHTVDLIHVVYLALASLPLLFVMELFKKKRGNYEKRIHTN